MHLTYSRDKWGKSPYNWQKSRKYYSLSPVSIIKSLRLVHILLFEKPALFNSLCKIMPYPIVNSISKNRSKREYEKKQPYIQYSFSCKCPCNKKQRIPRQKRSYH